MESWGDPRASVVLRAYQKCIVRGFISRAVAQQTLLA